MKVVGRKDCQNNLKTGQSDFIGFMKKFQTLVKGLINVTFKYKRMTNMYFSKFIREIKHQSHEYILYL